jgi:hypothetical protein
MEIRVASEASPDRLTNEDFALVLPGLAGVFDGASVPVGLDSGCVHGPGWYVQHLSTRLAAAYVRAPEAPLQQHLAEAIDRVRHDHGGRCDLSHRGTPAGTVCLVKETRDRLEYLVLCDSPLVVDRGDVVQVVTDERFARAVADVRAVALAGQAAIGSQDHVERVRVAVRRRLAMANQPDGYWIAAANPEAAYQAVTGTLPLTGYNAVRRAALLTDGASCAVERYDLLDWPGLLDLLTERGPQELINRVRAVERVDSDGRKRPRYKRHDDATAILCLFCQEQQHE